MSSVVAVPQVGGLHHRYEARCLTELESNQAACCTSLPLRLLVRTVLACSRTGAHRGFGSPDRSRAAHLFMPDLDRQERIRSCGGIVLGVSIDEDCQSFEHFLKEHPVAFQTTCESTNKRVSLDYGTSLIPETYVIDRQGRIARKVVGPQQWDSAAMTEYFDSALARN